MLIFYCTATARFIININYLVSSMCCTLSILLMLKHVEPWKWVKNTPKVLLLVQNMPSKSFSVQLQVRNIWNPYFHSLITWLAGYTNFERTSYSKNDQLFVNAQGTTCFVHTPTPCCKFVILSRTRCSSLMSILCIESYNSCETYVSTLLMDLLWFHFK